MANSKDVEYWAGRLAACEAEIAFILRCLLRAEKKAATLRDNMRKAEEANDQT